jgi:hypothetical protein
MRLQDPEMVCLKMRCTTQDCNFHVENGDFSYGIWGVDFFSTYLH